MHFPVVQAEGRRSANRQVARGHEVVALGIETQELEDCAQLRLGVVDKVFVTDHAPAIRACRLCLLKVTDRARGFRPRSASTVEVPSERVHGGLHHGSAITHEDQQSGRRKERKELIEVTDRRRFRDEATRAIGPEEGNETIADTFG